MALSRAGIMVSCLLVAVAPQLALAQDAASLQTQLHQARAEGHAPALGAVVVRCRGPLEVAVEGQARIDRPSPVSETARFNIGSNAKSMMATLVATYVAEGVLSWDTEVGTILSAHAAEMDPVLRHATLAQLLAHRSGVPAYSSGADLSALNPAGETASAQRLDVALKALRGSPAYVPDSQDLYSNAGYIIVGVMLETLTGQPFEQLMQQRVFAPLGIEDAVFGSPSQDDNVQPLGHVSRDGEQAVYLDADPAIPAFLQPAGDVSLTLADYGSYLREHLCGLEGQSTRLLPSDVIRHMHEPRGEGGVAMGWGQYAFDGIPASIHVGGTGAFSAFVAVLPSQDLAVATVVNSGHAPARQAALGLLRSTVESRLRTDEH